MAGRIIPVRLEPSPSEPLDPKDRAWRLQFFNPDGTPVDVHGQKGDKGDPGDQGPPGTNGTNGANGADGAAGPAGATWRGAWSSGTAYNVRDIVSYQGSSYVAVNARAAGQANPVADAGANWLLVAQKGDAGAGAAGFVWADFAAASTLMIANDLDGDANEIITVVADLRASAGMNVGLRINNDSAGSAHDSYGQYIDTTPANQILQTTGDSFIRTLLLGGAADLSLEFSIHSRRGSAGVERMVHWKAGSKNDSGVLQSGHGIGRYSSVAANLTRLDLVTSNGGATISGRVGIRRGS